MALKRKMAFPLFTTIKVCKKRKKKRNSQSEHMKYHYSASKDTDCSKVCCQNDFFLNINTFIQQGNDKLIKSFKTFIMLSVNVNNVKLFF